MGYERLAGRHLNRQSLDELQKSDRSTWLEVARQLAQFLSALHATPLDDIRHAVRDADRPNDWRSMLDAFRAELFPVMRPDACVSVEREFSAFLAHSTRQSWQPMLRHGDFGGTNLLFDYAAGRVSGVIDFGRVAFGDPAVDLAGLTSFDARLAHAMQPHYPELFTPETERRAAFYRSTFALQQALWARRAGDQQAFEDGIAACE